MDQDYFNSLPKQIPGPGFYGGGHTYMTPDANGNAKIVVQPIFSDGTWLAPPVEMRAAEYHEPVQDGAALPGTPYTWAKDRGYVDGNGNPIPPNYGAGGAAPAPAPTTDALNALASAAVAFAKSLGN